MSHQLLNLACRVMNHCQPHCTRLPSTCFQTTMWKMFTSQVTVKLNLLPVMTALNSITLSHCQRGVIDVDPDVNDPNNHSGRLVCPRYTELKINGHDFKLVLYRNTDYVEGDKK